MIAAHAWDSSGQSAAAYYRGCCCACAVAVLPTAMQLLHESGLHLRHAALTSCAPEDERTGCAPLMKEMGYPCGKGIM